MKNDELLYSLEQIEAALEKIACLGNGRAWGNSEGNCIAQGALIHLDSLLKRLRAEKRQVDDVVMAEVRRATLKFPTWPTDPLHALAVLGEEFGELTKATLQHVYEPHKSTSEDVREEAIQTAAMAHRFIASLTFYSYDKAAQHHQRADSIENVRDLLGYSSLSVRLRNILHYEKLEIISDLLGKTERDLLNTPNCGRRALSELTKFLAANGLGLRNVR